MSCPALLRATIGSRLAKGNYGAVHAATATTEDGTTVAAVAKRALAWSDDAEATTFAGENLAVEAEVNERLKSALPADRYEQLFAKFIGAVRSDDAGADEVSSNGSGEQWLLWERVDGPGGIATSLADYVRTKSSSPIYRP